MSSVSRKIDHKRISRFTYILYIGFTISYFLHIPQRLPTLALLRPDLIISIVIMFSLYTQQTKFRDVFKDKLTKSIFILLAYIIITLPFVEWPGSVIKNNFPTFVKAIVFFFFTACIIDSDKRFRQFINIFLLCQLVRVFEPLYLNITTGYWGSSTHLGHAEFANRLSGAPSDVVNPNGLAFVIVITFILIYHLWLSGNSKYKILFLLITPPMMYAMILTLSRSGFVALGIVLWNIFLKSKKKLWIIITIIFAAIVAWSVMNSVQKERYLSILGGSEGAAAKTYEGRIRGAINSFDTFIRRPIVGHGVGTSVEAIFHDKGKAQIPHIIYSEILIELGIIGFIIFMIFFKNIYTGVRDVKKTIHRYLEDSNNGSLVYYKNVSDALIVLFWMYLVFSLAQYGVSEFHWYLLGGLAVALRRNSKIAAENNKISI